MRGRLALDGGCEQKMRQDGGDRKNRDERRKVRKEEASLEGERAKV